MPEFLSAIIKRGGSVYEVGGCVRDRLLGLKLKDRDLLVTHVPIDPLTQLLKKYGNVQLVGKSFGIIKFRRNDDAGQEYDIALPRKEFSTGVGHRDFNVDFDPNIPVEEDLARRDFTVNAMALNLSTTDIVDPFNGREDLKKRLLRMVHERAFEEDPLRMLRAVQFASRFQLTIEPKTHEAIIKNAAKINTVSAERIIEEIRKLLTSPKPSWGFNLMMVTGLLREIFPGLADNVGIEQGNKTEGEDVFQHIMKVLDASRSDPDIATSGDLELMFAALFHDAGKARTKRYDDGKEKITFYSHQLVSERIARKWLEKFRATMIGVNPANVCKLIKHHMFQTKVHFSDKSIRRFINKIGPDLILKLIDLRLSDNRGGKYPEGIKGVLKLRKKIQDEIERKSPFSVRDLAVNGHDLMEIGIPEGRRIGEILKNLVTIVLDNPEKNTKETLIAIIKESIL